MLKVGLTGGIGSGKSTVSALLAERGATVIDADLIAREVVEPGTAGLAAVVAQFGREMLRDDGTLDRERLGHVVFSDPAPRAALNAIVHPLVGEETARQLAAAEAAGAEIVVFDVPLLVENGLQSLYDVVVVVATDPETQVARLALTRGMSEADARARIAAQSSLATKVAVATHVVNNDGTRQHLVDQVDALWSTLARQATKL
ncbi:MAG: dephospho-CoA kinase [Mycobacteriales bacterium]